jgi:tetratricopeptide (TPR) repeat protein
MMKRKTQDLERIVHSRMVKGLDLQKKGHYAKSIETLDQVLNDVPHHYYARLNKGLGYILMGEADKAAPILHKIHEENPNKIDVLRLCGKAYWMLNQYELAIQFYKRVIQLDSKNFESWLDLSALFAANFQNTEALYFATQALSLNPTDPRGHLNLGCALSVMGRVDDAHYCFETVLKMSPDNVSALTNIAVVQEKRGEIDAALASLDKALSLSPKGSEQEARIFYSRAYPLLAKGNLKEGWEMYAHGFKPNNKLSRAPKRKFDIPQWTGEAIHGKKLLIWREQGLGDELMFSHIISETFSLCDDIIIECEERLISLFQRSFPHCHVRKQNFDVLTGNALSRDFDYQLPMGSLPGLFRNDIKSFQRGKPYLTANSERVTDFGQRLSAYKDKKIVGICWRSGIVTADRGLHYAPLSSWKPIFDVENTVFVNLQYGDCTNELQQAREILGVDIIEWSDLDLRNDLEGLAALMNNLDCVISVGTAVAQMAGALGKHLMLMTPRGWTLFGQDHYPWFGNTDLFIVESNQSVEKLIPQVVNRLQTFTQ